MEGDTLPCILCGSPTFPPKEMFPGKTSVSKFIQLLSSHFHSDVATVPPEGLSLRSVSVFCEECLCDVTLATESGEQVERLEGEVRRLQQQLLHMMGQLCTLLDTYLQGMKRIQGKIVNTQVLDKEEVAYFRSSIANVVRQLSVFRPKLVLPTPLQEEDELEEQDLIDEGSPETGSDDNDSKDGLDFSVNDSEESMSGEAFPEEMMVDEESEEECDDPDYIKSEPESSSESSSDSEEDSDSSLPPIVIADDKAERKTIVLPKEKFSADMELLSRITDPVVRKQAHRQQFLEWMRRKIPCPVCQKLRNFRIMGDHLRIAHQLTAIDAEDEAKPVLTASVTATAIILKRNPFVSNKEELSRIQNPGERKKAAEEQYRQWRAQKLRCPVCQKSCARPSLRSHLRERHKLKVKMEGDTGDRGPKHPQEACDLCGKAISKRGMVSHLQRAHGIVRAKQTPKLSKVECSVCGKKVCGLTAHLKNVHNISLIFKKFPCDLCHEQVVNSQLVAHLQGHVGPDYVIRCPNQKSCAFACATPTGLVRHLQKGRPCPREGHVDLDIFWKEQLTCQICGVECRNQLELRGHLKSLHETAVKPYPCPISGCGQRFTCKQSVILHLGRHDIISQKIDKQPCSECQKKVNVKEMEVHLRDKHAAQEIIACTHCPFQFSTREHLVDHLYEHRFSQKLTCDICGVEKAGVFLRHADLREHYFKEHQIGQQWICDQCPKVFWRQENLRHHMKMIHTPANPVLPKKSSGWQCEDCGQVLRNKEALRSHQIRFHGAAPHGCSFCSETFTDLKQLRNHEKEVHRGVPVQKAFPCLEPDCGAVYTKKCALTSHHRRVHLGETGNKVCEHCGKAFSSEQVLRNHRDTVHLKLRNHVCGECGETFGHRVVLRRHMLIHTGERPFACERCGQRFRHNEVLKTHLEGLQRKGAEFKPNGPMKQVRKRVVKK